MIYLNNMDNEENKNGVGEENTEPNRGFGKVVVGDFHRKDIENELLNPYNLLNPIISRVIRNNAIVSIVKIIKDKKELQRRLWLDGHLFYPSFGTAAFTSYGGTNEEKNSLTLSTNSDSSGATTQLVPEDWQNGTNINGYIHWVPERATGNVVWNLRTKTFNLDQDINVAYNQVSATVASQSSGTTRPTQVTSAMSITGTNWSPGQVLYLQVEREGGNVSDTMDSSAYLVGVELEYSNNEGKVIFNADRAYTIMNITESHSTTANDSGSVSINIEKLSPNTSLGSGNNLLNTSFSMKTTAELIHDALDNSYFSTAVSIDKGDRLAIVDSGDFEGVENVCIALYLKPIN